MCGGATKHFFSMWIAERRILSRRMFDNPCNQFENLELVYYSGSKLVFCSRANGSLGRYDPFPLEEDADLSCIDVSHIYVDAIQGDVDSVQYPTNGVARREGHAVLISTENAKLCTYLHKEMQSGRNFYDVFDRYRQETQVDPLQWSLGPMGSNGPFKLDVNNDGRTDTLAVRQYGPGSIGEELIMLVDGRNDSGSTEISDPLAPKVVRGRPALIPVAETVFGEGREDFQMSRVLVRPFEWYGKYFVFMGSVYDDRPPEWAAYLVSPDNSFSEVCVLDRIPIHY